MYLAIARHLVARQAPPGIPPGVNPNDGVDANKQVIIGVSAFTIFLATVSTALRFSSRKVRQLKWGLDDWFMLVATVFVIADAACYIAAIKYGFGRHIYTLDVPDLLGFFKLVYATFLLYGVSVTAVKISVLLFYRRVFPLQEFERWIYGYGMLSIVWFVVFVFFSVFQCFPVAKAWNNELEGSCLPYLDIFIGLQAANILLDSAVLILPISTVMRLQVTTAKRIGLVTVFGLGGMSIVFAIVRLAILITDRQQTDISYGTATADWSVVEPAFEIFCGCLPCVAPFLKSARVPSWISSKRSGRSSWPYTKSSSSQESRNQRKIVVPHDFGRVTETKDSGLVRLEHLPPRIAAGSDRTPFARNGSNMGSNMV